MQNTTKIVFPGLVLVIAVLLAAAAAQAADRERDYEIALTKGQYEIELGNYGAAIGHLTRALELLPGDQEALVSLGVAYSRAGNKEKARAVLEQAVAAKGDDGRARYELGLVLADLGRTGEARQMMKAAAEAARDDELAEAARGFLREEGGRKKKFTTRLSGGLQQDSNVILEQDDPVAPAGGKKSDWRYLWTVDLAYAFLNTTQAGAEAGYRFTKTIHHELKDYNVEQHKGRLAGRYAFSRTVNADLAYDFLYTSLRSEHYSTTNRIAPRLSAALAPDSLSELHAAYERTRFFNTPLFTTVTEKNSSNLSAGLAHTVMIGAKTAVSLDYTYDTESAEKDYWEYTGHRGAVSCLAELGAYRAFAAISYHDKKYDGVPPGAADKRHDGVQELSAGVSSRTSTR
jgi:hypothetical protein